MAYNIAFGSSNGINVDLKFGETEKFYIYRVDGQDLEFLEIRHVAPSDPSAKAPAPASEASSCGTGGSCGNGSGCGGNGQGCGGGTEVLGKVALIEDCRAVVCKKIGFQAQKQFEKKAISVFDIEVSVEDALDKISSYYYKIDNRQSLRQIRPAEEE
ncbi:MAG: hypothetical protein II657_06600 [Clostridiales bacterium]|nr:hypothetical protein [Clostridiales bacterium]